MKQERKSNPYFGVEISRSKYKKDMIDYLNLLTVITGHLMELSNTNTKDMKELRKSIRKYIKENKQ